MRQADRDRLVALKKAKKRLITQREVRSGRDGLLRPVQGKHEFAVARDCTSGTGGIGRGALPAIEFVPKPAGCGSSVANLVASKEGEERWK